MTNLQFIPGMVIIPISRRARRRARPRSPSWLYMMIIDVEHPRFTIIQVFKPDRFRDPVQRIIHAYTFRNWFSGNDDSYMINGYPVMIINPTDSSHQTMWHDN